MRRTISIEELKQLQMDILQAVHDYCLSHGLHYSLTYGTLLGAIRHKGYIPWDDDIDIHMPRKDYEEFIFSFKHPYYKVYDFRVDADYDNTFAKVADTRTLLEENSNTKNIGINIDIFPIDNLFDTPEECTHFLRSLIPLKRRYRMKLLRPSKKNVWWKRIAIRLSKLLVIGTRLKTLAYELEAQLQTLDNDESKYVGIPAIPDYSPGCLRSVFERKVLDHYLSVPFENREFMITSEYDQFLSNVYGDYMTPPPVGKRTSPHTLNKIYWLE